MCKVVRLVIVFECDGFVLANKARKMHGKESGHFKRLRDEFDYPVYVGQEFWLRLTGDENFYADLRQAIVEVAIEARGATLLNETIQQLAATPEIKKLAGL